MPSAQRKITIKFDGTARGLLRAVRQAVDGVEKFDRQVKKSAATTAGVSLVGGLGDALGALPSQLKGAAIVAGAGIGASMAPALASAIISGTLLAVGGGVLAAGIVGAAKSPKVQNAWKKFTDQAGKTFAKFSQPFIQPTVWALRALQMMLKRVEPTIVSIGRALGPVVDRLGLGLALMVERSLPGIEAAARASVPLFDTLARHMPKLGDAWTGFFDKIAEGSPNAQAWFDRFLTWVETTLPKLGGFLTWLSNLGVKMDEFSNTRLKPLKDAFKEVGDFIKTGLAEAREMFSKWLDGNNTKIDRFITQVSGFISDTGPAFRITILGIAISLQMSANAIMEIVNQLDRLKNWYNNNRSWLQALTVLPIAPGGAQFGRIERRAHGGRAEAGRTYMVGDGGEPEILQMGARSGYITPLSKAQASGGGMPPIEVSVYIGDQELRGIVRTEVNESNRRTVRAVTAGAGAR